MNENFFRAEDLQNMPVGQERTINGHCVKRKDKWGWIVNGNGPFDCDTSLVIVNKVRSEKPPDKWVLLGSLVFVLVFVGVAYVSSEKTLWSQSKLTEENFLRVKIGMTPSDVKLILGEPTERKPDNVSQLLLGDIDRLASNAEVWTYKGGGRFVTIYFDHRGFVRDKTW